jgi:hypothetical protein
LWPSGTSRLAPTAAIIRRDHCLTAADRGTHRLAKHWMDAGMCSISLSTPTIAPLL